MELFAIRRWLELHHFKTFGALIGQREEGFFRKQNMAVGCWIVAEECSTALISLHLRNYQKKVCFIPMQGKRIFVKLGS